MLFINLLLFQLGHLVHGGSIFIFKLQPLLVDSLIYLPQLFLLSFLVLYGSLVTAFSIFYKFICNFLLLHPLLGVFLSLITDLPSYFDIASVNVIVNFTSQNGSIFLNFLSLCSLLFKQAVPHSNSLLLQLIVLLISILFFFLSQLN